MRVIDSHVHFPASKIIDDGGVAASADATSNANAAAGAKGVGYTSGRVRGSGARRGGGAGLSHGTTAPREGNAVAPPLKKHERWLENEKARWESAWQFPEAEEVSPAEGERRWQEECERYDFLKGVVFVTAGSNQFASEVVGRHPEHFFAYAHHDPLLPDAADRLEKGISEQGLRGYKMLGPRVDAPLSDHRFDPIWEVAQAHEVPVLIHFGIMGAAGGIASHINMNPLAIHDAAKRFPDVPFIVPHFGTGFLFETLNLCWACPNVYIDTSGSNQWMRWVPYEVTLESLFRKFRETIGASRIIFGTDSSWFPRGFTLDYLKGQNRAMSDVGYSEAEKDMVLYRNIAQLLKLE